MIRKNVIILITVLLGVIITLIVFTRTWLGPRKYSVYQLSFDDDKIVMSDGGGLYQVPNFIGVWFTEGNIGGNMIQFQMSQPGIIRSERNITVRFSDTQWKSLSLMDILPRQKTTSYHINAYLFFVGLEFADVEIGDRVNISVIDIDLADTYDMHIYVWDIDRNDNASFPDMYVPPKLYREGHAELIRENEDVWIINVDAWFIAHYEDVEAYYIRLSFIVTITFKEGYDWKLG